MGIRDRGVTVREFIGQVPMMRRSTCCVLNKKSDFELTQMGECVFDQGGYFVINGSEKVLVAQERQANNVVYCFKKKPGMKFTRRAGSPAWPSFRFSKLLDRGGHPAAAAFFA